MMRNSHACRYAQRSEVAGSSCDIFRSFRLFVTVFILSAVSMTGVAAADGADVVDVKVSPEPAGTYRFDVTVRHADTGWDDYADKWQVIGPDDTIYGERVLLHPHVDEQPFTRSQSGIVIPEGVRAVSVKARTNVDADASGGMSMTVDLPGR